MTRLYNVHGFNIPSEYHSATAAPGLEVNIAFFTGGFPIDSQTFVLNQITGLMDRGHTVQIFARRSREHGFDKHGDISSYDLEKFANCWPRDYRKLLKCLVSVPVVLKRRGILSGAALIRSLHTQKARARPSWFARTLVTLPHDPFDAIVCHFGPRALECLHLRDIGAIEGPLFTVFHGYDLSRHLQQNGRNIYEELFQRGDLMLPVSEFWKRRLIELGCDPQKIRVHHMGVDCSKYELQLRKVAAGEPIRMVSIARMVEKKGHKIALHAFAKVLGRWHGDIELHLVGIGPLKSKLERLAKQLDIDRQVIFHGWLNQEQIVSLLKRAHIFLAPSVTATDGDMEGIPVGLMEAMAVGLPVISTYHSGISELVVDGETGYLVPEFDTEALTEKMCDLLRHPEIWPGMGLAGRGFVEREFNIHCLNDTLVSILVRGLH